MVIVRQQLYTNSFVQHSFARQWWCHLLWSLVSELFRRLVRPAAGAAHWRFVPVHGERRRGGLRVQFWL